MYTIVALGNPGEEYEQTRHNAGRIVMRKVVEQWSWSDSFRSVKLGGEVFQGMIANKEVRVLFPDTYMNHSGSAVKKTLVDTSIDSLVIVYDDIDLPFGAVKLSFNRGAGGHNGLKSVIEALGTPEFFRVRVGIAPVNWFGKMVRPDSDALADYVLGNLTNRESAKLTSVVGGLSIALESFVSAGKDAAMSKFRAHGE